jgi:hypothetical protein
MHCIMHEVDLKAPSEPYITLHIQIPRLMIGATSLNHLVLNGLICGCVVNDSLAMIVAYSVIISWYTLDHDQYLQLEHWKHHRYISGRYSIYVHYGGHDKLDKVKPLIGQLKKE